MEELTAQFSPVTHNNGDGSWDATCQVPATDSSPSPAFTLTDANRSAWRMGHWMGMAAVAAVAAVATVRRFSEQGVVKTHPVFWSL